MASYIQTGDPNAHKVTNSNISSVPELAEGKQFVVQSEGVADENTALLDKRCDFWLSVASKVPI